MKILITGKDSYIGTSFEKWVGQHNPEWQIDTVDTKGEDWKKMSFSEYDTIFHVAGIAHVSSDPKLEELYYKVNRDLTIDIAKKAKAEGVKQFVFMSSIIVYGNGEKVITKHTVPKPENFYGNSKLQADEGIQLLQDSKFNVVSIRPPMIYGKGSKGNYPKLAKFAQITPIFPDIDNKRSMLHIDNLCECIRLIIKNNEKGYFYPQNKEYVKTSDMVKVIAEVHGRRIILIRFLNPIFNLIGDKVRIVNKVFGSVVYDKEISKYKEAYEIRNFKESISLTESRE
ncbi:MAG: NAD-dependent epimerase/dehydratase family protein [Clostridiales bacterium]|nr:NAD-dependent epimerase/dehydratase family protein [Clostridiales bacterium]MDU6975023.1 NAD-dependent epimerase/dehydratase family protein [Clostridiales bacterium]